MNEQRKVVLLVGSPKVRGSVSQSLGEYLLGEMAKRQWLSDTVHIRTSLRTQDGRDGLLAAVSDADLLVLAYPLYVDSLPAPVIEAMEAIASARRGGEGARPTTLVALVNCGFPEAMHNRVSLAICRRFAAEAGMEWAGGLAVGGGGMYSGGGLRQMGGRAAGVVHALDLAVAALDAGNAIPDEAVAVTARSVIPPRLYAMMGGLGWLVSAAQNGVLFRLGARPYAR